MAIITFLITIGGFAILSAIFGVPWYTHHKYEKPRIVFLGIGYFCALLILMLIMSSTA